MHALMSGVMTNMAGSMTGGGQGGQQPQAGQDAAAQAAATAQQPNQGPQPQPGLGRQMFNTLGYNAGAQMGQAMSGQQQAPPPNFAPSLDGGMGTLNGLAALITQQPRRFY